jgi:hypothetical protein
MIEERLSYLHRSKTGLHPNDPFDSLPILITVMVEADLIVLVILVCQVEEHSTTFKETLVLARCFVNHGRDTTIGCNMSV